MLTKNDLSYLIECLQEGNKIPEEYKYDLFPSINQEVEINFSGKMRKEDILSDTDEVTNVPFQLDKEFGTEDDKWSNKLIFGDNLQILKSLYYNTDPLIRDEIKGKVQLIYIDPPFATDRDFSSNGGAKAYSDKVKGAEFLEFLRRRLYLLREMLSETGLIYLHLDYRYVHYVKVIMDEIFGESTFVNEITWKRTSAHNDSGKYGINTEYILVYSKTGNYKWNVQYKQYSKKYLDRYRKSDPDGRKWTDGSLSAKGLSGGGYTYTFNGIEGYWRCPITTMKQYEKDNKLYYTSKGGIRIKKYLDKMLGIPLQALWDDIDPLNSQSKERVKYPTQKPEELLKRIILSCTNEGDLVMDCFAGSGTTLVTAEKLGRRWIGCDIGKLSMYVIQKRLLNIEHSPNIKTYKGKYKQRASNFQMLTAGLYDLSKVFSLSENDYISFVMDLFDVSPLKGAQINGIRVEGKKRDKFVKIYPYWEPEMRDADINEEYINELHQNIGANIKESFYLIAPATTVAFINDYYEIDGVRYYFLKIPYHVIQELHNKDFKKVRQPQSKNQVNSLDEAIGFHFIRQPQVESSFDSVKNQIIVSEFYSDYDYDDSSNFENLSMILVDYNLDGNFVMDDYFFVDELQKDAKKNNKKVLSIPLKDTGETVALVYVDVYGNEFREEINR